MKTLTVIVIIPLLVICSIVLLVHVLTPVKDTILGAQAVDPSWKLVEVYQDQGGGYHYVLASTQVYPTNTPTVTPSPTSTRTPTPTSSRTPTNTPVFTPLPFPTQEVATPVPGTPVPTPPPAEYVCFGLVVVDSLNLRSTPQTGSIIGGLSLNQRPRILESKFFDFFSNGDLVRTDVWFRVVHPSTGNEGWAAGYYNNVEYIRPEFTEDCAFAQWGESAVGHTVTTAASADTLNQAGANYKARGLDPKLTIAGEPNLVPALLAGGWDINFRPQYNIGATDCGEKVNIAPEIAAQNRVNTLSWYVNALLNSWGVKGTDRVVIQLENECWYPSAAYANKWLIAAVNACQAEGWICIPAVWGTGSPDINWLPELVPAMQTITNAGMYWGMNVGPYLSDLMLCDDVHPITPYTTWYGRKIRQIAPAGMKIWVTESARGNAEQTVDLNDYKCFYDKAKSIYDVINFWYYGGIPLGNWKLSLWTREQVVQFSTMITP